MSNVGNEYKIMEHGIKALLGKEEYDPPEVSRECQHVSDGYVYDDNPVVTTLQCYKCGVQYEVLKSTGVIVR